MCSDLVNVEVVVHHETDKAILVSDNGERDDAVWLPKSLCEIERKGKTSTITLPEQIAIDKGLV